MEEDGRSEKIRALLSGSPKLQRMFTNLIPYVVLQMKVCNIFACIPYTWDPSTQRIILKKSKWSLWVCRLQIIVHWIYTLIMLGYFASPGSMALNKTSNKLLGFVFLSCLVVTMFMRYVFWTKRQDAIMLWNALLSMEQNYIDASAISKKKRDTMSLAMMMLGVCTSFGLPGFMVTMLLVDPCKPPHLGYMIYKVGLNKCIRPPFLIRSALLIFDGWIWTISISSACFYVFHSMFLGLRCLDLYLQLLFRGRQVPLLRKAFESQDSKDRVCFGLYRELQLLARLYNKVFQTIFLPTLIATAIFVIVICLYTCIKLHSVIPMPGFAFFPLLSTDGFSVIFISRIASIVYLQSRRFVLDVKQSASYSRRTWFRKKAISLDMMKIRFGSNFIDEMTPLVFLDFSFTQTVSIMLLT